MEDRPLSDLEYPHADAMPMLGLGTYRMTGPNECGRTVQRAVEMGYRHIDTASMYDNEKHVGAGIEAADVSRNETFVATKVWHDALTYDDVVESAEASLRRLGLDAVDLLYVHWPANTYDPEDTLAAFDELYDRGLIDRIGVANFEPDQLREAAEFTDGPLFAVQVECHPLLQQDEVRRTADELGVNVVAYAPVGRGQFSDDPTLSAIAREYDASVEQVCLAWLLEKGVTPIPKSASENHLRENLAAVDLRLDADTVARIDAIDRSRRLVDPDLGPWN